MFKLGTRSEERLQGVDPRLIEIIKLALTISVIDFGIPKYGGLRDTSVQRYLFSKGSSKCDGIKLKSKHQSGKAFDMYAYIDGNANYELSNLAQVAAAILQASGMLGYELHWSGLWKGFDDKVHFELAE